MKVILSVVLVFWHQVCAMGNDPPKSTSPIPPAPPISLPVWSLAAPTGALADIESTSTSMNIITFCTAISVAPPKLYAISLYHETMTKDAFLSSGRGVLQLLRPQHSTLVPVLGKQSGYHCNKRDACAEAGFAWQHHAPGLDVLPECAGYTEVRVESTMLAGDHTLAICRVVGNKQWKDGKLGDAELSPGALDSSDVLYTGRLRAEGII